MLIKIRRIIGSQLYYSNCLPEILNKIEKTLNKNYALTLGLNVVIPFYNFVCGLELLDVPKKYFDYFEKRGHKQSLGGPCPPGSPLQGHYSLGPNISSGH